MNYEEFRRTGELSNLTVIVDGTEFKLHTFPLFTKSDYFKKVIASTTAPHVIRLDENFPGGKDVFNQLADYFYSIPITIDQKTIVPLRSAACFIECEPLGTLLDKRLDDILLMAKARYDLSVPLVLLERCTGGYQEWATKARIVDKCLQCIVESLARGAGLHLNKIDKDSIARLPVEWIVELIKLCPKENKLALLPFIKHYITIRVLKQTQPSTSTPIENEGEHQSAFTPIAKQDDMLITSDDEKRKIIDEIIQALGDTVEEFPFTWLNSVYEKSIELKCESEPILASYTTQSILGSTSLTNNTENLSDDVMTRLLDRINKHKEDHIKDPQTVAKLSTLLDSYVGQLRQRGTLTSERFVKLASCIPKEKRSSHDSLLLALDEILKDEKSTQLTSTEREELLDQIDFSRVSEETISACKSNKLIPQQMITDAALALCTKLRKQLEETQTRLHLYEIQSGLSRSTYTSSSKYRSNPLAYSTRLSPRSRSNYTSTYESPRSNIILNYSNYDLEEDDDYPISSRYVSSTSNSRYSSYPFAYYH